MEWIYHLILIVVWSFHFVNGRSHGITRYDVCEDVPINTLKIFNETESCGMFVACIGKVATHYKCFSNSVYGNGTVNCLMCDADNQKYSDIYKTRAPRRKVIVKQTRGTTVIKIRRPEITQTFNSVENEDKIKSATQTKTLLKLSNSNESEDEQFSEDSVIASTIANNYNNKVISEYSDFEITNEKARLDSNDKNKIDGIRSQNDGKFYSHNKISIDENDIVFTTETLNLDEMGEESLNDYFIDPNGKTIDSGKIDSMTSQYGDFDEYGDLVKNEYINQDLESEISMTTEYGDLSYKVSNSLDDEYSSENNGNGNINESEEKNSLSSNQNKVGDEYEKNQNEMKDLQKDFLNGKDDYGLFVEMDQDVSLSTKTNIILKQNYADVSYSETEDENSNQDSLKNENDGNSSDSLLPGSYDTDADDKKINESDENSSADEATLLNENLQDKIKVRKENNQDSIKALSNYEEAQQINSVDSINLSNKDIVPSDNSNGRNSLILQKSRNVINDYPPIEISLPATSSENNDENNEFFIPINDKENDVDEDEVNLLKNRLSGNHFGNEEHSKNAQISSNSNIEDTELENTKNSNVDSSLKFIDENAIIFDDAIDKGTSNIDDDNQRINSMEFPDEYNEDEGSKNIFDESTSEFEMKLDTNSLETENVVNVNSMETKSMKGEQAVKFDRSLSSSEEKVNYCYIVNDEGALETRVVKTEATKPTTTSTIQFPSIRLLHPANTKIENKESKFDNGLEITNDENSSNKEAISESFTVKSTSFEVENSQFTSNKSTEYFENSSIRKSEEYPETTEINEDEAVTENPLESSTQNHELLFSNFFDSKVSNLITKVRKIRKSRPITTTTPIANLAH